jgi:hypothetical protein
MASGATYQCSGERIGFHGVYLLKFVDHLRKVLWVFLCNWIYPQTAVTFLVGSSVARLGSQRADLLVVLIAFE